MSETTLTRADLVNTIIEESGLPRHDASEMVEAILREISASLVNGETVKLSSFGTFELRDKKERVGRNPKTGKEAVISARRVVVFRPSNKMKRRISMALSHSEAAE